VTWLTNGRIGCGNLPVYQPREFGWTCTLLGHFPQLLPGIRDRILPVCQIARLGHGIEILAAAHGQFPDQQPAGPDAGNSGDLLGQFHREPKLRGNDATTRCPGSPDLGGQLGLVQVLGPQSLTDPLANGNCNQNAPLLDA